MRKRNELAKGWRARQRTLRHLPTHLPKHTSKSLTGTWCPSSLHINTFGPHQHTSSQYAPPSLKQTHRSDTRDIFIFSFGLTPGAYWSNMIWSWLSLSWTCPILTYSTIACRTKQGRYNPYFGFLAFFDVCRSDLIQLFPWYDMAITIGFSFFAWFGQGRLCDLWDLSCWETNEAMCSESSRWKDLKFESEIRLFPIWVLDERKL